MAGNRCTVCMHPERVAIDRTIAMGTASFRTIAQLHGLHISAVTRHAGRHLLTQAASTPTSVARDVVQAVRREQERERRQIDSVWVRRLDKAYADTASAYSRAMGEFDSPDSASRFHGLDAAAKFLMVQARLCDTGLRTDGVLAGGGEARVTVNVEQLIVLPTPQTPQQRLEPTVTIDVNPTEER